jgi:hypothetical protein
MINQRTAIRRAMELAIVVLCMLGFVARAEYRDWIGEEEAANSRWVPRLKYIIVDSDAERETFSLENAPKQQVSRFYVSPRVAVGWDNYIYHPYLLTYSALFEPGYSWRRSTVNGVATDDNELALDGRINAEFLSQKPYATTFSFARGHDEVQYGFFNLASVDSQSWGGATGYRQGGIPTMLSFHDTRADADELFQRTISDDRVLDLSAHNERKNHNVTFFNYEYTQYQRTIDTGTRTISSDSSNHRVDLQDTEHFERSILKSTLRFDNRDSNQAPSAKDFSGTANYDLDLRDDLHNYEQGTYSQYTSDGFDSKNAYADTGLRHQLYESLTSTLDLHGTWSDNASDGATAQATSVGATVTEDYSKRLGNWGRLSLGDSIGFSVNHQSSSGGVLVIANESHVVPANNIVRLSRVRALTLVSITDSNNIALDPGDYTVIHTEPWRIQINPFGPSHIQTGAQILVTYTIALEPTASSTSFNNAVQLRLSFWNEIASIYARYSFTDNNSSSTDVIVDNEDVFEAGANCTWKGLTLNADYLDQHSTFFSLQSFNLSESYNATVGDTSTLGITLGQQWDVNTSFSGSSDTHLRQHSTFYNFMVTHDWHPLQRFGWKNEVGYQRQTGFNLDQNLIVARAYVNWLVGKIQVSAGYEHENVDYAHQSKLRDYVFFKLRRNF